MVSQKDAVDLFAAWNIIIQVASKCPVRGVLKDSDGVPLIPEDLSFMSRLPVRIFKRAFEFFSNDLIGWLECENLDKNDEIPELPGTPGNSRKSPGNLHIEGKGREGKGIEGKGNTKTWRNHFWTYLKSELTAYKETLSDKSFIKQQSELNPEVDIVLSLKKAHLNFWSRPAGWNHKKKKKAVSINWRQTFINAIDMNKVYKPRKGGGGVSSWSGNRS